MIKILDFTKRYYKSELNKLLLKRQICTKINKNIVKKIINEVKKHGDRGLIKYEKKFNKNTQLIPGEKKIIKSIKSLIPNKKFKTCLIKII